MIPVMCIVQEGQISTEAQHALMFEIGALTQRAFDAPADIDWIEVPTGSGFTAGRPSTTIVASLQANRTLHQSERACLLKQFTGICMSQTGRTADEVVTSIRDSK